MLRGIIKSGLRQWLNHHHPCKLKTLNSKAFVLRAMSITATKPSLDLSGIFPPIPTPFKENEDINWDELKGNLSKWEHVAFKGYVVQGSNGEYVLLSRQEKVDMVRFVRHETSKEKLIIAGSGCEGTRETIQLTEDMALAGADAVLVATPSFFKNRMNSKAMITHYTEVANASPVPVILYNVPSNTGIDFPLDAVVKLAEHENIIGYKDSGGNITSMGHVIQATAKHRFQVLAGSASFLMAAMQLGAVGGVCALANILGRDCCQLYSLIQNNELDEARDLQLRLIAPNQSVTRKYNVPALKYAMELVGYYGGPCRLPLTSITETEALDVRDSFNEFL